MRARVILPVLLALTVALPGRAASVVAVFDAFVDVCVAQVSSGVVADKSDLFAYDAEERAEIAASLRLERTPDAIWIPASEDWIQVQGRLDAPDVCQILTTRVVSDAALEAWADRFLDVNGWRAPGPGTVRVVRGVQTPSGFASRVVTDGFVQVSMTGLVGGETLVTILTAVQVQQTPASCNLWPGECD